MSELRILVDVAAAVALGTGAANFLLWNLFGVDLVRVWLELPW